MKQPDLGLRVSELRQQKGLTQEKLAELCEVSTRTIQRIESGEVDPRTFTINRLNEVLGFDFGTGDLENENFWLAALHLSSIFCILLIPLVMWSALKKKSYKIDRHGRDVLNFQITVTIMLVVSVLCLITLPMALVVADQSSSSPVVSNPRLGVLEFLIIGAVFPLIFIGFYCLFQGVKNTIRVLSDKPYHYPLTIKFVK
jgi:uncharacterized Tic20 family protein